MQQRRCADMIGTTMRISWDKEPSPRCSSARKKLLCRLPGTTAKCKHSSMALTKQAFLVLLVIVTITSATKFINPPPSFNGCYRGRSDGAINAQAVFDMGGVTGYVQFFQRRGRPAQITVNLQGLEQFGGFYPWHAHEFPVRDALLKDFPCSDAEVGDRYDPLNAFGDGINYTQRCTQGTPAECQVGDFSGKLGSLRNINTSPQFFEDRTLDLFSPFSVIGRALVIRYPGLPQDRWICANIEPIGCRVKNLRAEFNNSGEIQGEVIIRYAEGQDSAKIYVDLAQQTQLNGMKTWSLHFGPSRDGPCGRNEIAGFSNLHDFPQCSNTNHRGCPFGDLTAKCDPLPLINGRIRLCCTDTQLGVIPFDTLHSPKRNHFLYLRIADVGATVLDGCARFNKVIPLVAKAKFNTKDLIGTVLFYQASPLDRTFIQPTIESIRQRNIRLIIRENPVMQADKFQINKNCTAAVLGNIFTKRPGRSPIFGRPLPSNGIKTGDASVLGNLQSAIPIPPGAQRHTLRSSSHYLPLFGPHSIINRSLVVIEDVPDVGAVPIACGTIQLTSDSPDAMFASFTGYQK